MAKSLVSNSRPKFNINEDYNMMLKVIHHFKWYQNNDLYATLNIYQWNIQNGDFAPKKSNVEFDVMEKLFKIYYYIFR